MALKNVESRKEEFDALKDLIDPAELAAQLAGGDPPPADPPPADPPKPGTPPADPPPADPPKPGAAGTPPDATGILKEIFGDQFTSVDDLKNKDIPKTLKEAAQLREQVQTLTSERDELTGKLALKPKTNFANDNVALFNEFVKETGVMSAEVFNRLNSVNVADMDYMDAIILARLLDNPELVAKEPTLRKHVEKTYNVDPEQVEVEDLEINKMGLAQEGAKARIKLQAVKEKLVIPEPEEELPAAAAEKVVWTPEQKKQAETTWGAANKAMIEKLSKIPIYLPGSKEALLDFVIPEETQTTIMEKSLEFAVSNQLEANETNLGIIANFMYTELIMKNQDRIAHSIFEKARSMTQEESLKYYHNPSSLPDGDNPPVGDAGTDFEAQQKKIFDAEMGIK